MNVDYNNLSPDLIQRDLPTRFIGNKIIYFPSLTSTMDAARTEAQWGAEAGTVVIAGKQTQGRGRLKRSWISPAGGLAFSVILRPNICYLHYLIMLTSLAVTYAVRSSYGLNSRIKWPNDILIGDKKICGILIENDIRKNELKHSVIGVGINVNMNVKQNPEIASIATSLSDQLNSPVSRIEVLRAVLIEMDKLYSHLPHGEELFKQWKDNLITIGTNVKIDTGDQVYYGKAESVTGDGSLMLRQKNGSLVQIVAGDVMKK